MEHIYSSVGSRSGSRLELLKPTPSVPQRSPRLPPSYLLTAACLPPSSLPSCNSNSGTNLSKPPVHAVCYSSYLITPLPYDTCYVTYTVNFHLKGSAPRQVYDLVLDSSLDVIQFARLTFARDDCVDKKERDLFISQIVKAVEPTQEEMAFLRASVRHAGLRIVEGQVESVGEEGEMITDTSHEVVDGAGARALHAKRFHYLSGLGSRKGGADNGSGDNKQSERWRRLNYSHSASAWPAREPVRKWVKYVLSDSPENSQSTSPARKYWGKARGRVHAKIEEVLAYCWFYCSSYRLKEHEKKHGKLVRKYTEVGPSPVFSSSAESHFPTRQEMVSAGFNKLPSESRSCHTTVRKKIPGWLGTRESNIKWVWGDLKGGRERRKDRERNSSGKTFSKPYYVPEDGIGEDDIYVLGFEADRMLRLEKRSKSAHERVKSFFKGLPKNAGAVIAPTTLQKTTTTETSVVTPRAVPTTFPEVHSTSFEENSNSTDDFDTDVPNTDLFGSINGMNEKVKQLSVSGVWIFKKLAPNITDVTLVTSVTDTFFPETSLLNLGLAASVDAVTSIKSYFERNGSIVDRELREVFLANVPLTLMVGEEQQNFVSEQMNRIRLDDDRWELLAHHSNAFVNVYKMTPQGDTMPWGKATATIDASAEQVLAWLWDYCSNDRTRAALLSGEEKEPRELIKELAPNHRVYGIVKEFPWPVRKRRFVFETTWLKRPNGSFIFAWRPPVGDFFYENDLVTINDRFLKSKMIWGECGGYCKISKLNSTSSISRVDMVQRMDMKGNVPSNMLERAFIMLMSEMAQLRKLFNRDEEIDRMNREKLMAVMKQNQEEYSPKETCFFDAVRERIRKISESCNFKNLSNPDVRVRTSVAHIKGDAPVFRVSVTIDASVEECAAYVFQMMSRKKVKIKDQPGFIAREGKYLNNHTMEVLRVKDFALNLHPRFFLTQYIWKRTGEDVISICNGDVSSSTAFEQAYLDSFLGNSVVVRECASWDIKGYTVNEIPSSLITYTCQQDLGGVIAHAVIEHTVLKSKVSQFCDMRKEFSKDYEIDLRARKAVVPSMNIQGDELSELEMLEIGKCEKHFELHKISREIPRSVRTSNSSLISAALVRVTDTNWVKLTASVCCDADQALAFLLDANSRSLNSTRNVVWGGGVSNCDNVLVRENHTVIFNFHEEVIAPGTHLRCINEVTRKITWKKAREELFLHACPMVLPGCERKKSPRYRIDKTVCSTRIIPTGESGCTVEVLIPLDARDVLRAQKLLPNMYDFRMLSTMTRCFQLWRPLDLLDERDGTNMGKILMENTTELMDAGERMKGARQAKFEWFFEEFRSMRMLKIEHPWFETLMEVVITGSSTEPSCLRTWNHSCNRSLVYRNWKHGFDRIDLLDKSSGYCLGSSFHYYLRNTATEVGAVASWLNKHKALRVLAQQHSFLKPLFLSIGKEKNHSETFLKLVMSVSSSAFSWFDFFSDVYTIYFYRKVGFVKEAFMMTIFLALSVTLQLMLTIAVHSRNKRRMFIEIFGTLTFTKPALNKWRVLTNKRMEGHELLPPLTEMAMFKLCEVFAESIPVTVVQVSAIMVRKTSNLVVLGALVISCLFVAELITYITFVRDISEESRNTGRIFYGFVPLSGANLYIVRGNMFLLSICQLISKSMFIAILWQEGRMKLILVVSCCEMAAFFMYKVVRGDFRYFLPLPGCWSLLTSVIARSITKVLCDFTAMLHTRHPLEMGGFYWMVNMIYSQVSLLIVLQLPLREPNPIFFGYDVHSIACVLFGCWLFAICSLICSSNAEYRHTFYSTWTSKEFQKRRFAQGDDQTRLTIVTTVHRDIWKDFEGVIKEWLGKAWGPLHNESPDWFTERISSRVPSDLIPYVEEVQTQRGERKSTGKEVMLSIWKDISGTAGDNLG